MTASRRGVFLCMGLGCNAAGVVGCRIVDSPRERLIAVLTNSLVPCNGRFPTLITLLALFCAGGGLAAGTALAGLVVLGVAGTLLASRLLSATLLRGEPSAFAMELPPYRPPRLAQVAVRSVLDRTIFVLGRAAAVAAPAGLLIWLCANWAPGGLSLFARCAAALDGPGRLLGMDGVILTAFLLSCPANELFLPLLLMGYLSTGVLAEPEDLAALGRLLTESGWTGLTAVCVLLFTLFHWPCTTTCLTVWRETGKVRWAAASAVIPTLLGGLLCLTAASAARLLGLA